METETYLKNIRITPKKLRFFIPQVKRLRPTEALIILNYMTNKPAKIFYQAIKSALSNATNALKVTEDLLEFKLLSVDEGHVLKRHNPGSRGSAKPYKKRLSHIKIVLRVAQPVVAQLKKGKAKVVKVEEEKVEPKEEPKKKVASVRKPRVTKKT